MSRDAQPAGPDRPAGPAQPAGPDDERDLAAALYAFGLEEGDEARQAALRETLDPAFAAAVMAWRLRMAELDETAEPDRVDPSLWPRIEGTLDGSASAVRASAVDGRRADTVRGAGWFGELWHNLFVWRMAAFAGAAAALALAFGLATSRPPGPVMVAVLLTDANRAAAVVDVYADGRTELVPLEPIAVPEDRILQVWTLWDRTRGPVSLGLLDRARQIRLPVQGLPATIANQLFEITLEPKAGSPTGRPTGPILMKGTASPTL